MMINLLSITAHGYHSKIDNLFLFLTISTCNKKAIALTTCILFTIHVLVFTLCKMAIHPQTSRILQHENKQIIANFFYDNVPVQIGGILYNYT